MAENSRKHALEIMAKLNTQRFSDQLCDITFEVEDLNSTSYFKAHKSVLCASSDYFQAMFQNGMKESQSKCIPIMEVKPSTFSVVLDYIYLGELKLTTDNWQPVFMAVGMFQLLDAVNICCQFAMDHLDVSNCLGVMQFATNQGCEELNYKARNYFYEHFTKTVEEEEFLTLAIDLLEELMGSEHLHIEEEQQVLKAGLSWLHHDLPNRKQYLKRLMDTVRFPLITNTGLKKIQEKCDPEVTQELMQLLQENRSAQLELTERSPAANFSIHSSQKDLCVGLCHPRLAACRNIYIIGGYCRHEGTPWSSCQTLKSVECYSTFLKHWQPVSSMHKGRSGHGVCKLNGFIYVLGGEKECMITDSVECFDPHLNRWVFLANMLMPRTNLGVAALGDRIYAIGGWIGTEIGISIEYYEPSKNVWELLGSMPHPKYAMGVASYGDEIYMVGGIDDICLEVDTVESFNPITGEWRQHMRMSTPRCYVGVAVMDDSMYVIGGWCDNIGAVKIVEKWSFTDRKWSALPPLIKGRAGPSVVAANGFIYVIGGRCTNKVTGTISYTIDSMEYFSLRSGKWVEGPPLGEGRCEGGAVAL